MSLIMTDISETIGMTDPMFPGLVIGIIGMIMAIINSPLYRSMLNVRCKKYADKIITLSEKIMRG